MCLVVNEQLTQEVLDGPEEIEVYKELWLPNGTLNSEFCDYEWKPGWNETEGPPDIRDQYSRVEVHGGCFHAYLDPFCSGDNELITVKFKALKSDLVKAGRFCSTKCATFIKLYLSQEDYDNAVSDQS